MVSALDALGGLLKRIGNFEPTLFSSDFNSRLILQKTIYLMEQFGLGIGYYFSWYLRGPYSPSLARDTYTLAKIYPKISPVKFADPSKEKRFCEFLDFIRPFSRDHAYLERIASIQFLCTVYQNLSSRKIFLKITEKIPSMTFEEFQEIRAVLRSHKLLENDSQ